MNKILEPFKRISWKYLINYIAVAVVGLLFTVLTFSSGLPQSTLFLLEKITMNIILVVSLSLVVGFLGELSLGHAGFMCVGAYIGGKVACILSESIDGDGIVSFLIALLVGAAVAGAFGFIIGLPALRLKGDYLAIVTLAFGEIVKTVFANSSEDTFGGSMGLRTPRFDKQYLFIIGFVLVLITLAVIQNLIRSKHGRAITAIRDNEIAARATGINVTKYKLIAFVISAIFAGVAGVFYSFANSTVKASVFDYNYSIDILIMVVIGGMGNISGAIISATAITYINTELQTLLTGGAAVYKDIIYALILIVIIIYNNASALKSFRERFNLKALLKKTKLFNKTRQGYADDEGKWDRVPTKIDMDELLSVDVNVVESIKNPDKEEM
ncbi:MAG: branched-chain amino acid ABC transporter permease [Clostridia bacterium]|nr:branched-chain amino acid ABC transporter permease [Clostridia bacterium]